MNRNPSSSHRALAALAAVFLLSLTACKTMQLPEIGGRGRGKVPGAENGYLAAKLVAFRHAMENMPADAKRYGDEFYAAAGIQEADPKHAQVLIAGLRDMHPPVVEASRLYSRGEESKWIDGKPAIVWTSQLARLTKDRHVVVQLGWMHSRLVYEFYEYEIRYIAADDSWDVVDYKVLEAPGSY